MIIVLQKYHACFQRADLRHAAPGFYPPLHEAVCAGKHDIAALLLDNEAPPSATVKHKETGKGTF